MAESLTRVDNSLPAFRIDNFDGVDVVRDDLLSGGTKARVLPALLESVKARDEVVYAPPAYGYAQIALAVACGATGRRATVFVAKRKQKHPRTAEAARHGAKIVEVPHGYLSNVQSKARAYAATTGATLLPFGFDTPEFAGLLEDEIRGLGIPAPGMVWCAAGSGTLCRVLQRVWPGSPVAAVAVGRDPVVGRARMYRAKESFEVDAKIRPPFPSCSNYDAKVWRFAVDAATDGRQHLFWNVAA